MSSKVIRGLLWLFPLHQNVLFHKIVAGYNITRATGAIRAIRLILQSSERSPPQARGWDIRATRATMDQ